MESISVRSTAYEYQSIWERIVMNMVLKMNRGELKVILPSGATMYVGDGKEPFSATLEINDEAFFKKVVLYGDVGFGEAYVDGLWDTNDVNKLISWFLLNIENAPTISGSKVQSGFLNILKWINRFSFLNRANTKSGSKKNISDHYDLNNDFFSLFLDPTMTYSAAYFKHQDMSLEEAQYEKYRALADRVKVKEGDHVLEIGTGWGGNAIFLAKNYGCKVTTTTISKEQYKYAVDRIEKEGLKDKINVLLKDYRDLEGTFDKIVSIEMLEAVGHKYLKSYFDQCGKLLKKDGILGIQVITSPDSRYESLKNGVDWIQKHIFPGSLLPSIGAINKAVNDTSEMTLVELEDIGLHYAKTLKMWAETFNINWNQIKELGFDDRFRRKWNYYLGYCEAAFGMRNINVMQLVYTRPNNLKW